MIATAEQLAVKCPEPGLYFDVPDAEYRAWDAASNSDLSIIHEFSPMHMKYRRENPPEPTPSLEFGSATHCAILTPNEFASRYIVAEECCAMVKSSGRKCSNVGTKRNGRDWLCGVHGKGIDNDAAGQHTITAEQKETIENIKRAVGFHQAANALIQSPGENEISAVFIHPENGLRCKFRLDGWRPEWETIFDLKTTENASRAEFERTLTNYGYHRQAAFYLDGATQLGLPAKHFALIPLEKSAPYGVATYRIMGEAIDAGREELKRLVRIYKNCKDSGNWYGYSSEFQDITISNWKMRQIISQF